MKKSLNEYREQIHEQILDLVWRQWVSLGVSGHSESDPSWLIDPEALLLFTCTIGRYEPRLFDEVIGWLDVQGTFLNIQRLRRIQDSERFSGSVVLASIAGLMNHGSDALKWKRLAAKPSLPLGEETLFIFKDGKDLKPLGPVDEHFKSYGLLRGPLQLKGSTQKFAPFLPSSLILQLRALLGPTVRCEIIAYLLTHESAHPSQIAREAYYYQKTVQDTLVDMHASGLIQFRATGREKYYWLNVEKWLAVLNRPVPAPRWIIWAPLFSALEQIWLALSHERLTQKKDPLFISSELRKIMKTVQPVIERAGFGSALSDDRQYLGESYSDVFFSDIMNLMKRIS